MNPNIFLKFFAPTAGCHSARTADTRALGQAITSPANLNALLLAAEDSDGVHIDEAHELATIVRRQSERLGWQVVAHPAA